MGGAGAALAVSRCVTSDAHVVYAPAATAHEWAPIIPEANVTGNKRTEVFV